MTSALKEIGKRARVDLGADCVSPGAISTRAAWEAGHPHPAWLTILQQGLGHRIYLLEAHDGERLVGRLPLALVSSRLFGRFLVSLPYLNCGGVAAEDQATACKLIDQAVQLADELDVRYLELRHEQPIAHPALRHSVTSKVQMRLALPALADELWKQIGSKVRNQVKNGQKQPFAIKWGGDELLHDFYDVFSRNMRDLGTPVFSRRLFQAILENLPGQAELCVVYSSQKPIAAALLVHNQNGVTEVPSASSLREYNSANANMLMYWQLLARAIERGQATFDFGRSTVGSGTFRFKEQWGAQSVPTTWQYYLRHGTVGDMRPENSRHQRMIRIWRRLPLPLTRMLGPAIVRGIP
jgi:FemAB-related protein (PEP-CTERM system-associated)